MPAFVRPNSAGCIEIREEWSDQARRAAAVARRRGFIKSKVRVKSIMHSNLLKQAAYKSSFKS